MKKLIGILVFSIYSFAAGFISLHQATAPQGLINKFKQYLDENGQPTVKEFYDGTSFVVTDEAQPKNDSWCGNIMPSYKIYVPAGLENVTIGTVAKPNSSYYIWYVFVPDGQNYNEQTLPFNFVKMIDAKVIYQKWNTEQSGWLYLRIIQASNFVYSQFGHVDNPTVYLSVKYLFKDDMTDFNNWLKNTNFTSNGDPVDMFSQAYEISRYCSNYGDKIAVYGNTSGVLGSSLVPWLQTDDPSLSIVSDQTTIPASPINITYAINYKVGDKPIDAISVDINNNTTDGVLLQNKLDECMEFVDAIKESGKEGVFIYSDNGINWYLNKSDAAIANNIHYVGYFLEDTNPTDGVFGEVLSANESGSIKVIANMTQECLSKSGLVDVATMKYRRDGTVKNVESSVTITASSSSATTTTTTTTTTYSGTTTVSTSGDSGYVDDTSYYGEYTTTTTISDSQITDSDAQQECESGGGKWIDGTCLQSVTTSSSSSSSYVSSMESTVTEAQIDCENEGGVWIDGTCLQTTISSSSSSLSVSSVARGESIERIVDIVEQISQKDLPVKGYFVQYGPGAFDWIYKSVEGGLYKLEGMQEDGYLVWRSLQEYFPHAYIENNQLILGDPQLSRDENTRDLELIKAIKAQDAYRVNGYFTQYGKDAFDWVYVVEGSNNIYKLDGMTEDGKFKWLPLTEYIDDVKVEKYKDIIIGKSSSSIRCLAIGGEWDEENELCIVSQNYSQSSVSSSINSSSISSTSSLVESGVSEVQSECESDGGIWVDGTCLQGAISSNENSSSSLSSTDSSSSSSVIFTYSQQGEAFPSY